MAKAKGPLFSIQASGKLGGALYFSNWKRQAKVNKMFKPRNPKSTNQTIQRTYLSRAIFSWRELDSQTKEQYAEFVEEKKLIMSGYNYYLSTYINEQKAYFSEPVLDGCVAWWKCDENSGNQVSETIFGNTGTFVNYDWAPGWVNSGLLGNGLSSYVLVGTPSEIQVSVNWTFQAFVKPTDISHDFNIMGNQYWSDNEGIDIVIKSTDHLAIYIGQVSFGWDDTIPEDVWTHIVLTCNGTKLKVYLNGIYVREYDYNGVINYVSTPFRLIADRQTLQNFRGVADEFMIYDRALTPEEIEQNYRYGHPLM